MPWFNYQKNSYFMQLGFSSNITSDMVILTNFVKNFNFCGRVFFDLLVAKPMSDLYSDSSYNFQSNDWQKVQYNTDLLNQKHSYLYREKWHWLQMKRCEMKWLFKNGEFIKWNLINWRGRKVFPLRGDEMGGPRKCLGTFRKSSTFHGFYRWVEKRMQYLPKFDAAVW